jgi:hypothetical protein
VTDVFKQLSRFSWRGTEYPVLERTVSFAHENAKNQIQYRNGAIIETTGAHNWTFRYKLALREDIAKGPYQKLFENGYAQLVIDTRNKERGTLVDPVLGEFECVPVSFTDQLDVQKRDGTDVEVEFEYAPLLGEMEVFNLLTLDGLRTDAGALDAELKSLTAEQAGIPEGTTEATVDALDAISGAGAQFQAQKGKFEAGLEDFAFKCEKVEKQIEEAENPRLEPLRRASRRNREVSTRLAKRGANPAATVKRVKSNYDRAIAQAAKDTGMTVDALVRSNPVLAKIGYVPAGTVLVTTVQKQKPR